MSSNPYHNDPFITRSNYEEYFLLYVDDELTAQEKAAVDQFLLLNPDLQQELEILMQTKLPVEQLPMEETEALLSASMKRKELEEALLLYIDNELNDQERKNVEETLQRNTAYRLQYEQLLKTKSDPGEIVVYPFKEELYRRKQRRIPLLYWRAAAVVLLAVGLGTFVMNYQQQQPEDVAILPSGHQPQTVQPSVTNPDTKQPASGQPAKEIAVEETIISAGKDIEKETLLAIQKDKERQTVNKAIHTIDERIQPAPAEEDIMVISVRPRPTDAPVLIPEKVEKPVKKSLTKEPVTSEELYTYTKIDASVNPVPADADEEEKSKSSLKGLLRKATRFVERRTNINVTNDDEELLIGSVAISLK